MATGATGTRPVALRLAAAAQAGEAAGLAVAGVFAAMATATGKSYQLGSGIALTVITFGTAAGLVAFVVGLDRARPWSRTPVVMVQLFVIIAGFTLLDGHRPAWGVPALLLAVACLAGVFTPASLRALNRPRRPQPSNEPASSEPASSELTSNQRPAAPSQPAKRPPPKPQATKPQATKNQQAKNQQAKNQSTKAQPAKRQPSKRQPSARPPAKKQPAK